MNYTNDESANSIGPLKAKSCVNKDIQVTIHLPDKIPENIKQQKINRIYDILSSGNFR